VNRIIRKNVGTASAPRGSRPCKVTPSTAGCGVAPQWRGVAYLLQSSRPRQHQVERDRQLTCSTCATNQQGPPMGDPPRSRRRRRRERTPTTVSSGGDECVLKLLLKTLTQTRAALKALRRSDAAASRARVKGRSRKPQHPAKRRIGARIKRNEQREKTSNEHPNKPVTSGFNATSAVCSTVEAPKAPSVPAPAPQKLAVSVETQTPSVPAPAPQKLAVSVETQTPSVPAPPPQNSAVSVETQTPSVPAPAPQNSAASVEAPSSSVLALAPQNPAAPVETPSSFVPVPQQKPSVERTDCLTAQWCVTGWSASQWCVVALLLIGWLLLLTC
jgi:hypothetical protein